MGNFRSDDRNDRSRPRSRSSGGYGSRSEGRSSYGGRSEGRGGFGRDRDRDSRPREMHDVTCDKCGKQCQVPFKPTGGKPVLCSDCFREKGDSNNNFNSRNQDKSSQPSISAEQFNQLNTKLDKILLVLQDLELDVDDEDDEGEEDIDEDEDAEEIVEESEDSKDEEDEDLEEKDEEDKLN